jgi:hypothetical protein
MVNALINLSENANRVLNVVKAKHLLKGKAEAIEFVIAKYIETEDDRELRPEFIRKIYAASKGKFIRIDDFGEYFRLKDDAPARRHAKRRESVAKTQAKRSGTSPRNL